VARKQSTSQASTKPSKHQQAYAAIRQRIVDGEFEPGSRLVIPKLARELDVSALPIREALRRLEAEGLVQFDRNVGARVTRVDGSEWEAAMHVLSLLEGYAAALAAEHLSAAAIAELREINAAMRDALERSDIAAARDLNRQFHARIYDACPSEYVMGLVRIGWDRLDSMRGWGVYYLLMRGAHLADEHQQLLELIESKAPAAEIEAFAREHKLRTIDVYLQNKDVLPLVPGIDTGH
jgi:DNA-binding GntR family transcriptional regulator